MRGQQYVCRCVFRCVYRLRECIVCVHRCVPRHMKGCVCMRAQVYLSQECEFRCANEYGVVWGHGCGSVSMCVYLVVCTLTDAWPHPSPRLLVSLVSRRPDFQGSPPQPRAITLSRLGCGLSTQWDYCSSRSRWASEASQVVGKFICLVHRF